MSLPKVMIPSRPNKGEATQMGAETKRPNLLYIFVAINKTGKIVVRYDENENPICFDDEIGLD